MSDTRPKSVGGGAAGTAALTAELARDLLQRDDGELSSRERAALRAIASGAVVCAPAAQAAAPGERERARAWLHDLLSTTVDAEDTSARSLLETAPSYVRAALAAPPAAVAAPDLAVGGAQSQHDAGGPFQCPLCKGPTSITLAAIDELAREQAATRAWVEDVGVRPECAESAARAFLAGSRWRASLSPAVPSTKWLCPVFEVNSCQTDPCSCWQEGEMP